MVKRIFVIEPNLIKASGHPIQYVLALQELCRNKKIRAYVIPNRNIDSEVKALMYEAYPIISRTCFQFNSDNLQTFYEDLHTLNDLFAFKQDDLIIITSCYSQELKSVASFLQEISIGKNLRIVMNFHQLYPPTRISSEMLTSQYQNYWTQQLVKAFKLFPQNQSEVSFWTSLCEGLHRRYKEISKRTVGKLPFLFAPTDAHKGNKIIQNPNQVLLGFLGDGRQEKGLLIFLWAINDYLSTNENLGFIIQNSHPRGYSESELNIMHTMLSTLQTRVNVKYFDSHLDIYKFQALFSEIDVVILPYHPMHYEDRASMIFVESVINVKPVIVSKRTWMAKEIEAKHASGITFDYDICDLKRTIFNFKCAVEKMMINLEEYRKTAIECSTYYQELHTVESYMQRIYDFYGEINENTKSNCCNSYL